MIFSHRVVVILTILVAFGPKARAENVTVTARTTIWAEISEERGVLHGWLADDLGERLANERVVISAGAIQRTVVTNRRGEFEIPLPAGARAQTIQLEYRGNTFHRGSTLVREVDPTRLPVELQLIVPTVMILEGSMLEVQVHAERNDQPLAIPFIIRHPATDRMLTSGSTDETGWAHLTFDPRQLGRPGRHLLHASFLGDHHLAPTLARAETTLVDSTTIALRASHPTVLPDQMLRLEGSLTGVFAALPGREVTIEVDGRPIETLTTASGGAFEARLRGNDLTDEGTVEIVARFDSIVTGRRSGRSAPIRIEVSRPRPLAIGAFVAPALATVALVLVVLLMTRRRKKADDSERTRPSMLAVSTGFRPSIASRGTIRRVEAFDFSGTVWDPVEEHPVAGSTLTVDDDHEGPRRITAQDGSFRFDPMKGGPHRITVTAVGYVDEEFEVVLPHAGQFHDTRIDVVQIRHRALEVYRDVARPLLPKTSLWGRWTPREVAIHAVGTHPWIGDEIAELTSCFESLYYSPQSGTPSDLDNIRTLAETLDRTRGRGTRRETGTVSKP